MIHTNAGILRASFYALLVGACFLGRLDAEEKAPTKEELKKEALQYNEVTGQDPINGAILKLLENKERTEQLLEVAAKLAEEEKSELNVNASYIFARTARALRKYDEAEKFYRLNAKQALKLRSVKKLSDSYNDLIEVLYLNRKFKEAELACAQFLEIPGDAELERRKMLVLRTMIRTQAKQGKIKEALAIVDKMLERQPDNWLTRELRAWVLREAGQYEEAVKTYQDVLTRIEKDKRLDKEQRSLFINDVRYTLSGVFIDWEKIKEAGEELQKLIEAEKDNPTYYNDLGYIWANHDMNLKESEDLIRKAIEMDREQKKKRNPGVEPVDNAAYLDSLGWVLFKRKKYKEALKPLLDAVKQEEGKHVEIYDHLGEVYMKLGEKEKALEAWKKGLKCVDISARDEKRKEEVKAKVEKFSK